MRYNNTLAEDARPDDAMRKRILAMTGFDQLNDGMSLIAESIEFGTIDRSWGLMIIDGRLEALIKKTTPPKKPDKRINWAAILDQVEQIAKQGLVDPNLFKSVSARIRDIIRQTETTAKP